MIRSIVSFVSLLKSNEHRGKVAIGLPHSDRFGVKKIPFQLCFTTLALNTYVLSTYLGSSKKKLAKQVIICSKNQVQWSFSFPIFLLLRNSHSERKREQTSASWCRDFYENGKPFRLPGKGIDLWFPAASGKNVPEYKPFPMNGTCMCAFFGSFIEPDW